MTKNHTTKGINMKKNNVININEYMPSNEEKAFVHQKALELNTPVKVTMRKTRCKFQVVFTIFFGTKHETVISSDGKNIIAACIKVSRRAILLVSKIKLLGSNLETDSGKSLIIALMKSKEKFH